MKNKILELLKSENTIAHNNYHKSISKGNSQMINYWGIRNIFSQKLIEFINSYAPDEAIDDLLKELALNLKKDNRFHGTYKCMSEKLMMALNEVHEELYPEIYKMVAYKHNCTAEELFNAMEGNLTISIKELDYYARFFDKGYQWGEIRRLLH
jgi:hypothetical protein